MKKIFICLSAVTLVTSGFGETFKIIAIPDTQELAKGYPNRMNAQMQWISDRVSPDNIAFVTHLGDIVNDEGNPTYAYQWDNAVAAMALFDGDVPYSVCIGNHDYHARADRLAGVEEYVDRFGPSRYSGYSWYKGSHRDVDHYQIFSADGREWLHLNLEYQPDSESMLWAQRVLDAHPTLPAIFSTHAFYNGVADELGYPPYDSEWGAVSHGGRALGGVDPRGA